MKKPLLKHFRPQPSVILFAIALLLLLFQLGFALSEYARHTQAALRFPYSLDYGEGPLLDQTLRLAGHKNIYRNDLSEPPYTISNYPPLFPLLQVPFARIFGPAFWYGRVISTLGVILAALFIGLTLHILTDDWIAASIGGLTLLAFPYILHWSAFNRVDSLALGLSWAGLFTIVRWPESRKGLILSGILLTASIYTKQSYALAAPLTAFVWLLQIYQRRRAFQLLIFIGGGCLGAFLLLNLLTHGGFYLNIVTANINEFSLRTAYQYFLGLCLTAGYLVFAALMYMILERLGYFTRSWPFVTPYLLSAALSVIMSGKAGSWVNYLFEPAAALSLAAGAIIAWPGKNYWFKTAAVLLLLIQVHGMVNVSREQFVPLVTNKVGKISEIARLAKIVQDSSGPVLADQYMGLLPLTGHKLYFQPFEFSQLSEARLWDANPFIGRIHAQEFPVILLYEPMTGRPLIVSRWTKDIRDAIWANYQLKEHLADTWVYVPRN